MRPGPECETSFHPDVRVYSYDDRVVVFRSPRSLVLRRATAATRELIGALSAGVPAGELGADRLGTVHQGLVKRLGPNLVHRFSCGGRELMRVEPAGENGDRRVAPTVVGR